MKHNRRIAFSILLACLSLTSLFFFQNCSRVGFMNSSSGASNDSSSSSQGISSAPSQLSSIYCNNISLISEAAAFALCPQGLMGFGAQVFFGNGSTSGVALSPVSISQVDSVSSLNVVFKSIANGRDKMCGLTATGAVYCWGSNIYGPLGGPSYDNVAPAMAVSPILVDAGTSYQQVSPAFYHVCGLTTSGVWKCWGADGWDGRIPQFNGFGFYNMDPTTAYSAIAAGLSVSCGVTTAGLLKCCGSNQTGEVGIGNLDMQTSLVEVDASTRYKSVSASKGSAARWVAVNVCGITVDNVLKCWGDDYYGQLGDGTTSSSQLTPEVIDAGVTYRTVVLSGTHTCGITTAGVLKCWGLNDVGQLGDGTTNNSISPEIIDPGVLYSEVSVSEANTCAVTQSGIVKCWGDNSQGQIGNGTQISQNTPTPVSFAGLTKSQ